jgi:hypothetical protein
MNVSSAPTAGRSAEHHFKHVRRIWRRRMAATLAVASGVFLLAAMLAARLSPWQPRFIAGMLAGAALTLFLWAWDDPPEVIAKWRRGYEGERATEKALRALGAGWHVHHDIQGRFGNLDHIVVGPGGVFLLETKNLSGRAEVEGGVLHVRFPESPIDDYSCPQLARAIFGAAAGLRERLKGELGWIVDVYPIVVLVGPYPQRCTELGRLAYVGARELAGWLGEQPRRVAPHDVEAIHKVVASLPAACDIDAGS